MKTEKEIIKMKNGCQKCQRSIVEIYGCQDPALRGYEQALHWVLMSNKEETKNGK